MYMYIHMYMYMYIYICMYIYMYRYIYVYIFLYFIIFMTFIIFNSTYTYLIFISETFTLKYFGIFNLFYLSCFIFKLIGFIIFS